MSDHTEQLHNPVTEASQAALQGSNSAETLHQHDEAGADLSTEDWLSHMKSPANENSEGPIIREMPGYSEAGDQDADSGFEQPASEAAPKFDHKIKRSDNIGETMEAQAQMAVYAMSLPPKFGAWAITKDWNDPRTEMDEELKGFLMQVMKPVIAKRRNIFSDEVFFYAGVLVYLVWCVTTLVAIWKDKKAQEEKEKEIKAKEAEIAALKAQLNQQVVSNQPTNPYPYTPTHSSRQPTPPSTNNSPYQLGGTPGKNRAANRDKYLIDDQGNYCYPPIGWQGTHGLARNGIIMKEARKGDLIFLADIDDLDFIVYENRIKKGEQKGEVAFNRIFKAFQSQYHENQLDKLRDLINFHIEMQQQYLGMK